MKVKMTALMAALCASAAVGAADHGKANVCADGVVLENAYLKLTVDRLGGATARSFIDKADGRELAKEYLTPRGWNGAFGRDRCVEEHAFPGAVQHLVYTGDLAESNGVKTLRLVCTTNHWRIGKWTITKTYTLEKDAKRFRLDWSIRNDNDEDRIFTPWAHNIVAPDVHETVYAARDGIVWANTAHDFFHYPERNWLADIEKPTGKTILFAAEWNQLLSQYWCWWNNCHCTEWVYVPKNLKPGEAYETSYWIGVSVTPDAPASVTPDGAVTWKAEDGKLVVTFSPLRFGTYELQPVVNGNRKLKPVTVTAKPDTPVVLTFDVAAEKLPAAALFELKFADSPAYFKNLGNTLQFVYDIKKDVTTVKPNPWPRAKAVFESVGSTDVPARKVLDGVYETSPLRKVFKDDRMDDGKLDRDHRLVRGGRYCWQFTVVNTNKRFEVRHKIYPGYLTNGKGACIPLKVTEIKWIHIDLPTYFSSKLKIGDYPDPIVPLRNDNFIVAKGENASFLIEAEVPTDAPDGDYTGTVTFRRDGVDEKIALEAEVVDVTLPKTSFLKSTAGLRPPSRRLMQEVGYAGTQAEFTEAIRTAYMKNRVCPRETDISWGADEKTLGVHIQNYIDAGATTLWIPDGFFTDRASNMLARIIKVLREKKAMDRAFYYIADEASIDMYPEIIKKAKKFHTLYPDLRILQTCYDAYPKDLFGTIDIWCNGAYADSWRAERYAKGDRFMTSNLGSCNLEDSLAAIVRQFCTMKANLCDGFLYWNMINGYGDDNPWVRIAVSGSNGGHGHIMFPHWSGPVETVRWKGVGYGIELFDLITLLDQKADAGKWGAKKARDAVYERIRDDKGDLLDETQLESFRSQLIDALD